ncbi:DUF5710 domain-containing protein [Thiomicrospira microaerophila]|uniref:DUF5710 domain-containing protein n=1 Tax=Thiomicrospira microaerophila TaxID=406020 RepID=UPI0038999949
MNETVEKRKNTCTLAHLHTCTLAQLWLDVKFIEKDAAVSLGGRWCSIRKKWYVPFGLDINLFKKWFKTGG